MFYQFQHFGLSELFTREDRTNFNFPLHLHRAFEFITVSSGKMDVEVDGTVYTITKGEAVMIFPHQIHSLSSTESCHTLFVFSPNLVNSYASRLTAKVPVCNKFKLNNYIAEYYNSITEQSSILDKKGLLYLLCANFDSGSTYKDTDHAAYDILYKTFEFVENNYQGNCSLEELSAKTYLSYSYLSRYFKQTTGISFNNYVNQYRISKACELLSNTDNSVLQCAYEVGYKSLRSFNRNFKLYTNLTPYSYRASDQAEQQ